MGWSFGLSLNLCYRTALTPDLEVITSTINGIEVVNVSWASQRLHSVKSQGIFGGLWLSWKWAILWQQKCFLCPWLVLLGLWCTRGRRWSSHGIPISILLHRGGSQDNIQILVWHAELGSLKWENRICCQCMLSQIFQTCSSRYHLLDTGRLRCKRAHLAWHSTLSSQRWC